ncbi:MAG TPA: hypothetical protein VHS06_03620, partial [Chloroflexota bacterium]|nr:hypothetical protein [Chloroflexota bacterium]
MSDNTELLAKQGASAKQMSLSKALLVSVRPKQWSKNGLLFLGLVFSRTLTHPDLLVRASLAFLDFCLLASATYLIND